MYTLKYILPFSWQNIAVGLAFRVMFRKTEMILVMRLQLMSHTEIEIFEIFFILHCYMEFALQ